MEDNLQNNQNSIRQQLESIDLRREIDWEKLLEIAQSLHLVATHEEWIAIMHQQLTRIIDYDLVLIQKCLSRLGDVIKNAVPQYKAALFKLKNCLRILNQIASKNQYKTEEVSAVWDVDVLFELLEAIDISHLTDDNYGYLFAIFHQIRIASAEDFDNVNVNLRKKLGYIFNDDLGKVKAALKWTASPNFSAQTLTNSKDHLEKILIDLRKEISTKLREARYPAVGR